MARLLGAESLGDRAEYWWLHKGEDGKDRITIQTVQESDPIIASVARRRELPVDRKSSFRLKAEIPVTLVEEAARVKAAEWGVRVGEAFREIATGKTDRAKSVWNVLTAGRDFRKFQVSS